jgi:hypothetical protein
MMSQNSVANYLRNKYLRDMSRASPAPARSEDAVGAVGPDHVAREGGERVADDAAQLPAHPAPVSAPSP